MPRKVRLDIDIAKDPKFVKKLESFAQEQVEKKFRKDKRQFISDFKRHKVTKEINAGPTAENRSNTLGGRGNLFSFIGFPINSDPIEEVLEFIHSVTKLEKKGKVEKGGKKGTILRIGFTIDLPAITNFEQFKLPWEPGKSWVLGIEKGISGFGNYIFHQFFSSAISRSTTGLQAKRNGQLLKIRSGSFKTVPYITQIINDAEERFRSNKNFKKF